MGKFGTPPEARAKLCAHKHPITPAPPPSPFYFPAIDNDDGSAFFDTHHNVLWSASSAAAYGGNSLKSDFGGQ